MPPTTTATKPARELIVLRRYEIKKTYKDLNPGDVVLVIRNDKGVEYTTILRRTKNHSCTCPSYKPCYHIVRMAAAENARWEAEQAAKVAVEVEETKVVTVPAISGESPMKQWCNGKISTPELAKQVMGAPKRVNEDWRETAPLTKNNKAFSILR